MEGHERLRRLCEPTRREARRERERIRRPDWMAEKIPARQAAPVEQ
jgi:hypothetical protein